VHIEFDATSRKAIDIAWETFRTHGRWPSTKEFLLRAIDSGLTVQALQRSSVISLRAGHGEEVRPTFEAALSLPEVRDLLAPLPAILRQAASAFVDQALLVSDHTLPGLHFREVKGHWGEPSRARMAFDVLRSTSSGFFVGSSTSGTDPEDVTFHISTDYLRYEHVRDLHDVLYVREARSRVDPGPYPCGPHLEILKRIHDNSKRQTRWPRALSFAIEMRDVGYVPQLLSELRPRFVRTEFQANERQSIHLQLEALRFVDPSGDDRRLFASAVRGIVAAWRNNAGPVDIPVTELATSLDVTPERLGPIVALLESAPWCSTGHVNGDSHRDLVLGPGDPVLVLRNAHIETFEEYVQTWDKDRQDESHRISFETTNELDELPGTDTPHLPSLRFGFVSRDSYKRVLEADVEELRRTIEARAWKASLILIGGVIEAALLDVLSRREDVSESHLRKTMSQASMMDLVVAGVKLGLVPEPALPFAERAKDYRDLVHPYRSGASPLRPAIESVRAMLHVVELVVNDLGEAARDGRISRFELT
jgi:hypothetical protein